MNIGNWIACGLFGLWGIAYLIIGLVRKVRYQAMTGAAVILLAASMPVIEWSEVPGWALVAVGLALGIAALVMRFRAMFGRQQR